jgi:hypothetical protein
MKYIVAILMILICIIYFGPIEKYNTEAVCKESQTSTPYCKYTGKVDKFYINDQGLVLFYLKTSFNIVQAKSFGYNVKSANIMAIQLAKNQTNNDLYNALNYAFQSDVFLEIHSRGTTSGYMKIDRVWLFK